jgi:hypothetical protein
MPNTPLFVKKNRVERTISPTHRIKGSTPNPVFIIGEKYKNVKRFYEFFLQNGGCFSGIVSWNLKRFCPDTAPASL